MHRGSQRPASRALHGAAALAISIAVAVGGCAPLALRTPRSPVGPATQAADLEAEVAHALHTAGIVDWSSIRIEAEGATVRLAVGERTEEERAQIRQVVSSVRGVQLVELSPAEPKR